MEYLVKRTYTGNIRELRQLIRRIAVRHVKHKKITMGEIPVQDRHAFLDTSLQLSTENFKTTLRKAIIAGYNLWEIKNITMEESIQIALDLSKGNKELAAKRLGVTWRAILQFRKKNGDRAALMNKASDENLQLPD
jgi:transcriptional regulator with GAF, ATPase, and Fis domain